MPRLATVIPIAAMVQVRCIGVDVFVGGLWFSLFEIYRGPSFVDENVYILRGSLYIM